jgi:hypothetical protein
VKGDDVGVREVFQQFDFGIDQLGQRDLVVHSRLERLESERLWPPSRWRTADEEKTKRHTLVVAHNLISDDGGGLWAPSELE